MNENCNIRNGSMDELNSNNYIKFNDYLKKAGYSEDDIKSENIRNDVVNRLKKFSFGSSKIKLNISPAVYTKMARDKSFKKKMDEIIDDFLSEDGELSWMTKEARAGGGEISLTIDSNGKTTYTGKLYGIPGWEDTENKDSSSIKLSEKLKSLLKIRKYKSNIIINHVIADTHLNGSNINSMIAASQLFKVNSYKK